ncbi:hypothetical protein C1N91_01155 [Curtobacterium sp. SGAir0471]|uniref:hypothetical protein n=1 Tax=Curtobacterium sp. SGAir0471 TaxID=2070337 RepID=UPI0010CD200B|nr:hypothetical protein [Curtobacterium sp. SGAir0471]QCR42354.1 hypothetical protein C1N91_01155 [Curtobacterium sp. SGAir0471]
MTPRTLLALGAAALAFAAGTVGSDVTAPGGAAPAAAAEDRSDVTSSAQPLVRVTDRELRRVDTVELDAESLVLRHGDAIVADVPMRDARSTVSLLNRLLGTPSRTQTAVGDGGACFPAGTTYTWGGAVRVAALDTPSSVGNAVEIRVLRDSVRSRAGDRVELTGPDGVQVGDDVSDELDAAPRADKVSFGSGDSQAWQLLLEAGWVPDEDGATPDGPRAEYGDGSSQADDQADGQADDQGTKDEQGADDEQGTNGVSALTNDTEVTVIGSPMPVHARRSC